MNSAPYTDGWMIKLRLANPDEKSGLLSADEYSKKVGG